MQSDRVGGFFQEQRFELHLFKSRVEVVKFLVAFTDAAEIEFKVSVFLPAAFFKQHVSQTIALFSFSEEVAYALQTRMEGKIIGTPRIGVMVTQSCLIDHGGEHRNGRIRHQAVQICKEAIAQIAVRAEKSELVLLSTYLALMQNGGIVTPIPKLKLLKCGHDLAVIVLLVITHDARAKTGNSELMEERPWSPLSSTNTMKSEKFAILVPALTTHLSATSASVRGSLYHSSPKLLDLAWS